MKSPICFLCNFDFRSEFFHFETGGGTVRFADFKPLPEGTAGHPRGLEWFCRGHLSEAQALAFLTAEEALARLKEMHEEFPPYESKPLLDPELWVTSVGPNRAKVFSILRQARQINSVEAKNLIYQSEFKVAQGWPRNFEIWRSSLIEIGAKVEVRFP